jgi:hypothetical protein
VGRFGLALRACVWTREAGLTDLDKTVDHELPGFETPALASIDGVSSGGVIVGTMIVGLRSAPYALVPVPEPNGAALAALALVVCVGIERGVRGAGCTRRDRVPARDVCGIAT